VLGAAEHPTSGADAVAAGLDAHIELVPPDVDVVVLGHGFGGIVAVRYAATHARVRRVVTLGTPHQGSQALPYRWLSGNAVRVPVTGSPADVMAIYSDFDAWLVPVDNAYYPGGFNIAIGGVGHCAMLRSRRVADLIVENLARPPAIRSSSTSHADQRVGSELGVLGGLAARPVAGDEPRDDVEDAADVVRII
jgi:pimeloyl-ACP methyl ester carboxylesterase